MDSATEQKLVQGIYDRIYDILTYSPSGGHGPAFNAQTTLLQIQQPGQALNPSDFANAVTPTNPTGNLLTSEAFSRMVDPVPSLGAVYRPSTVGVENTYGQIVNSANTTTQPTPSQVALYNKAYAYLNTTTTITDFSGNKSTQTVPSQVLQTYQTNQLAYQTALSNYRLAFLSYNLALPSDQQKWQAVAGVLQTTVNQAFNNWRNAGAAQVEQAQGVLASTINDGIRNIITEDQQLFANTQLNSQTQGSGPWHLSYGMPSNWGDPNPQTVSKLFAHYDISTSNLNTSSSSSFTTYGGGAGFSLGLFSIGGSYEHSSGQTHHHMDATNVHIQLDLCVVQIMRPWLNGLLFNASHWYDTAFARGGVSDGNLNGNAKNPMKLLPVAFVVARNIKISGNFSQQDLATFTTHDSGGGSVGWGPFSIGGHYSHDTSSSTFQATNDHGTITVPGMQIIAWVNQIVPFCPPNDAPNH